MKGQSQPSFATDECLLSCTAKVWPSNMKCSAKGQGREELGTSNTNNVSLPNKEENLDFGIVARLCKRLRLSLKTMKTLSRERIDGCFN